MGATSVGAGGGGGAGVGITLVGAGVGGTCVGAGVGGTGVSAGLAGAGVAGGAAVGAAIANAGAGVAASGAAIGATGDCGVCSPPQLTSANVRTRHAAASASGTCVNFRLRKLVILVPLTYLSPSKGEGTGGVHKWTPLLCVVAICETASVYSKLVIRSSCVSRRAEAAWLRATSAASRDSTVIPLGSAVR